MQTVRMRKVLKLARQPSSHKTDYALGLLKEWSSWLVGIQTLAIGLIGKLLVERDCKEALEAGIAGSISIIFFLASIIAAAHLLVALPAFSVRHAELKHGEDFLGFPAYESPNAWVKKISLLHLVGVEMYTFLLGIIFFVVLTLIIIWQ